MQVYKCDRCGKVFDEIDVFKLDEQKILRSIGTLVRFREKSAKSILGGYYIVPQELELCRHCLADLSIWFQRGAE